MQETFQLDEAKTILNSVRNLDPIVLDLVSEEAKVLIQKMSDSFSSLITELEATRLVATAATATYLDLKEALEEYAKETGQNVLFHENVRLCLEQVKARRGQP